MHVANAPKDNTIIMILNNVIIAQLVAIRAHLAQIVQIALVDTF